MTVTVTINRKTRVRAGAWSRTHTCGDVAGGAEEGEGSTFLGLGPVGVHRADMQAMVDDIVQYSERISDSAYEYFTV